MSNTRPKSIKKDPSTKRCYPNPLSFFTGAADVLEPIAPALAIMSVAANTPTPFVAGASFAILSGGSLGLYGSYLQCVMKREADESAPRPK